MGHIEGHAGEQAVAAVRSFGVDTLFTLNGGHIWPLYEACRNQGVRVVDTRHEQSATFAAEAYAKLTRKPGIAAYWLEMLAISSESNDHGPPNSDSVSVKPKPPTGRTSLGMSAPP